MIVIHSNFLAARHGFWGITRLCCQPDMSSSSVLREGALHAPFYDWLWKSDHDFVIAFHSNFYLGCISEITRFYCKPDMTSLWILRQGALHAFFHDCFWKIDHDLMIVIYSNFLSVMLGFRDCKPDMSSYDFSARGAWWLWLPDSDP